MSLTLPEKNISTTTETPGHLNISPGCFVFASVDTEHLQSKPNQIKQKRLTKTFFW